MVPEPRNENREEISLPRSNSPDSDSDPKAAAQELLGSGNTAGPRLRPTVVPVTESSDPFSISRALRAKRFPRTLPASFLRLRSTTRTSLSPPLSFTLC